MAAAHVAAGWRPIGPFSIPHGQTYGSGTASRPSVSGRISSIAVDPANATHLLIGAAGGGVWQSLDTGATWEPRTDQQPSLAIGAVAFDPSNSQKVYAGTGEGDFYSWLGAGLLRSVDGGATWNVHATAPFAGVGFYELAVDWTDGQRLLAATTAGLFRSLDGGATWTVSRAQLAWDLSIAPALAAGQSVPEVLAACNDGVQRSTDGGATWTAIALPGAPAQWFRLEVCHAPSAGGVAYVVGVGTTGVAGDPGTGHIWRRATAGGAFTAVAFPSAVGIHQASYDWCAAVDPGNPDALYVGGIELVRGVRSGANWTWTNLSGKVNGDCIHPDQHHIAFSPADSKVVYAGCDGGIYRSPDRGVSWRSLNTGLCIGEFEYLASHPTCDAWLIGGSQDNGTQRYEGGEVWPHVEDGDGGDCGIDAGAPGTCFHTFHGMGMQRSTTGGAWASWSAIGPYHSGNYQSLFYPPVEVNGGTVCQAGQSAFISTDATDTTNPAPSWTEVALPASEVATAIAIDGSTKVYVGTSSGQIFRIVSSAGIWGAAVALTLPRTGYVSDLLVDPTNSSRLWATYSDMTGGHIYRSDNGGAAWTDVSAGLPTIPFNAVAIDPAAPDTVYAAADVGVFRSLDAGASWVAFHNNLPNALAVDLVFHPAARLLRVGTRNRGVWEIDVDRATMPEVEVYVRDSSIDTGRRTPSPSGADPFAPPALAHWWESTDIKVDSPPYQVANLDDVDFERFEDDHGVFAGGLIHESTERGRTARVYVQVHNRGVEPALDVAVKVFSADASLVLPNLPTGFWTNFPNNALSATQPWQPIAGHKIVPSIRCGRPAVVGFEWAVPAGQAAHSCLLAVTSAQNDPIAATDLDIATLVLGQQKCAQRNLAVVDPVQGPERHFMLNLWRPRERDRYRFGADPAARHLPGLVLGRRLAEQAYAARLRRRKLTERERGDLGRFLDASRAGSRDFDLDNAYLPSRGPWLEIPPGRVDQPDRVIVLLEPQMATGRFALMQWDERGRPVGGFTFQLAGKGAPKPAASA